MDTCGGSRQPGSGDLLNSKTACLLWGLPIGLIVAGNAWIPGRIGLWIAAFLIAGLGCLANAARCGRTHCYLTGPLYLGAALFVALSALGVVRLHPGWLLIIVIAVTCIAECAEIPLGRYRSRA